MLHGVLRGSALRPMIHFESRGLPHGSLHPVVVNSQFGTVAVKGNPTV